MVPVETCPDDLAALICRAVGAGSVTETHTAFVFLTRDRAYKLKKRVCLGYLDHRSLAARERACRAELSLNRALAGDVYREVVPVTREATGDIALGGAGEVIDWLLVMRRLPDERMLDIMLSGGALPGARAIATLARKLASFYRSQPRVGSGVYLHHLRRESLVNLRNLVELKAHIAGHDPAPAARAALHLLRSNTAEIRARGAAGAILEGHGDLRPEHVCLTDPPVIFDRIEFSSELRTIDVHDEVNYLGLECALLGAPGIGPQVRAVMTAAGFAEPSGDLLRTYGLFRCLTRARLSLDHLRDARPRTPEKWPRRTVMYLQAANALLSGGGVSIGRAR